MVRFRLQIPVFFAVLLLATAVVFAQGNGKRAGNANKADGNRKAANAQARAAGLHVTGTVVSAADGKLTVTVPKTGNSVYKVEAATAVTGLKTIAKTDLATGQWATVQCKYPADESTIEVSQIVQLAEQPKTTPREKGSGTEVGQLTVAGDQLSLRTADKDLKIATTDKTQYSSRSQIAATDLKAGDIVAITGREVAGENVATTIVVEPSAGAAKADKAAQKGAAPKGGGAKANKAAGGGLKNRANGANGGA